MANTYRHLALVCMTLASAACTDPILKPAPKSEAGQKMEIKRFRFQRHGKHDFERLVVEFQSQSKGGKSPQVKVSSANAKQPQANVDGVSLVGAIPESTINETFSSRSKYLGNISINADSTSSFTVKTALKETATVDSFWLENPSRLVLDVFPSSSPRAAGPAVLEHAAKSGHEEREVAHKDATTPKGSKKIVCFDAAAQLTATVTSTGKAHKPSYDVETDGTPVATPTVSSSNDIVCYPKNAQVNATIKMKKPELAKGTSTGAARPSRPSVTPPAATPHDSHENPAKKAENTVTPPASHHDSHEKPAKKAESHEPSKDGEHHSGEGEKKPASLLPPLK